ncbi:MAG: hypothetical protein E7298_13675 [Lachnospiraceae bacterium]|nr:hypothetical protein [Lachnospiraceae bacterium]
MWRNLETTGTKGSENGIIIKDEEYDGACRLTLEKCERYYAITCGVYGAMVHTAFFGEDDYNDKYESIKKDLQEFMNRETTEDEELDFYQDFVDKY